MMQKSEVIPLVFGENWLTLYQNLSASSIRNANIIIDELGPKAKLLTWSMVEVKDSKYIVNAHSDADNISINLLIHESSEVTLTLDFGGKNKPTVNSCFLTCPSDWLNKRTILDAVYRLL